MEYSPLLGPVVALIAWTLVMLFWMAFARGRAFRGMGKGFKIAPGARGGDLDGKVAPQLQWPSHNYNHLMEQPTIFYAIVFALILMDFDAAINVYLAWGYVALRIAHSIVQATVNIVPLRFALFFLASLCLLSLTVHAGLRLWH